MKPVITLLVAFFQLGLAQVHAQRVIQDVNAELRNTGPFRSIEVSGAFNVYISQNENAAVAVSAADQSVVSRITAEVRNGTLFIGFNSRGIEWSNKILKAYISVPMLEKIRASGACDVFIEGELTSTDLELELSGSSDFRGKVVANNLRLLASGSSDFYLQGRATNLKTTLSGSSDIKAFELDTDYADIVSSGASDVSITAQKEIKVKASGSSDVNYKGKAVIREINASGSSEVRKRD
jgi:hypothetical protein